MAAAKRRRGTSSALASLVAAAKRRRGTLSAIRIGPRQLSARIAPPWASRRRCAAALCDPKTEISCEARRRT
jgi:hypothetical protein